MANKPEKPTVANKQRKIARKSHPKKMVITICGKPIIVLMYRIGTVAKALGITRSTLWYWEDRGIVPRALYTDEKGRRIYTELQMKELIKAREKAVRTDGEMKVKRYIAQTCFPKLTKAIWEDYPYGVHPSEYEDDYEG